MIELALGLAVFTLALLGLSLGVILKKRTPLKGSCHFAAASFDGDGEGPCETCSCSSKPVHLEERMP